MNEINLIKVVSKDFELQGNSDEATLLKVLIKSFDYLLNHDFSKLLQILYRADVSEERLKQMLAVNKDANAAEMIAHAYLSRQKAKVETWKKYSTKNE